MSVKFVVTPGGKEDSLAVKFRLRSQSFLDVKNSGLSDERILRCFTVRAGGLLGAVGRGRGGQGTKKGHSK